MTVLSYTIPGDPIPKARARVTKRGTFTPPSTREYSNHIKVHTILAVANLRHSGLGPWPVDARYEVQIVAHRSSRNGCDIDNLAKSWLDSVQKTREQRRRKLHVPGALFDDDAQVDHLTISRGAVDARHPRLVVIVRSLSMAESEAVALAVEQCMADSYADSVPANTRQPSGRGRVGGASGVTKRAPRGGLTR